jgi:hypothetical protein
VKTRFGHRITTLSSRNPSNPTNFAVLSVFRSHFRCESFLSAPFVAVQFPGGSESLVADSPGGRSPLSPWKIALPLIRIILESVITIADSETFFYVEMKGLSVEIEPARIQTQCGSSMSFFPDHLVEGVRRVPPPGFVWLASSVSCKVPAHSRPCEHGSGNGFARDGMVRLRDWRTNTARRHRSCMSWWNTLCGPGGSLLCCELRK